MTSGSLFSAFRPIQISLASGWRMRQKELALPSGLMARPFGIERGSERLCWETLT